MIKMQLPSATRAWCPPNTGTNGGNGLIHRLQPIPPDSIQGGTVNGHRKVLIGGKRIDARVAALAGKGFTTDQITEIQKKLDGAQAHRLPPPFDFEFWLEVEGALVVNNGYQKIAILGGKVDAQVAALAGKGFTRDEMVRIQNNLDAAQARRSPKHYAFWLEVFSALDGWHQRYNELYWLRGLDKYERRRAQNLP